VKVLHKKHEAALLMNTKANMNIYDGWISAEHCPWIQSNPEDISSFFFCIKKEYATWKK